MATPASLPSNGLKRKIYTAAAAQKAKANLGKPSNFKEALGKLTCLFVFGLPTCVMAIAAVLGAPLALAEGWTFSDGFFFVAQELIGAVAPLTDIIPEGNAGKIFALIVSCWSFSAMAFILVLFTYDELFDPLIKKLHYVRVAQGVGSGGQPQPKVPPQYTLRTAVAKTVLLLFVIVPVMILLGSVIFGGLLALLEDWTFEVGFYSIAAQLSLMANPLVDDVPEGVGGKIKMLVVGSWGLGFLAIGAGLAAGPQMRPICTAMRLNMSWKKSAAERRDGSGPSALLASSNGLNDSDQLSTLGVSIQLPFRSNPMLFRSTQQGDPEGPRGAAKNESKESSMANQFDAL